MNKVLFCLLILLLPSCSTFQSGVETVQKYWPRAHDPIMFDHALTISIAIDNIDCDKPEFNDLIIKSMFLSKYAELRKDPQTDNLKGLHQHFEKLKSNPKKIFCTFGKTTAKDRINVVLTTWSKR